MTLDVIVLAAGKGTGMRSDRAKALYELAGQPFLHRILDVVRDLLPRTIAVVVGHKAEEVIGATPGEICWVRQEELLGTGHAAMQALEHLPADDGVILITYGSLPLVSTHTLRATVDAAADGGVGVVTAELSEPAERTRVVRNSFGEIRRFVKCKDANHLELRITEISSGIFAAPKDRARAWLGQLTANNASGEYYLDDLLQLAAEDGVNIRGVRALSPSEVLNVRDGHQLAELERIQQRKLASKLIDSGAQVADLDRIDIRGEVTAGANCFIDVNVIFNGKVELGENVRVGAGAVITDSYIGDDTVIEPHTVLTDAVVRKEDTLGGRGSKLRTVSSIQDSAQWRPLMKCSDEFDVFVCHASEDKDNFVRPLAEALRDAGNRVWYDEFTLTWGDRLRRSIEHGLASSRFGIVVLSPNFFEKEWPQRELDGLTALELDDGRNRILPVWHNIDASGIQKYAPTLGDVIGVPSKKGVEYVVTKLSGLIWP